MAMQAGQDTQAIAAVDLGAVSTLTFERSIRVLVLGHSRSSLLRASRKAIQTAAQQSGLRRNGVAMTTPSDGPELVFCYVRSLRQLSRAIQLLRDPLA
jgi:hypothetical protein